MTSKTAVGYIGLGNIGKPSAQRLIGDQYQAHVYDVDAGAVEDLVALGAIGCAGAAELAAVCGHVGICVRDGAQVDSLLYGPDGLLSSAAPDTIVAIHSTVSRDEILKWAADAAAKDVHLIDAGISGGAQGAQEGRLVYMVGGDAAIVARARPVFMTSAADVIHAGALGAGMVLKLCNNLMQYMEFLAMSEATRLAEAVGMNADTLREVGMTNGVVNDQMHSFISNRNALMAGCSEQEMEALFGPFGQLGEKDLDCALQCAGQMGLELPFTERLREVIYPLFMGKV